MQYSVFRSRFPLIIRTAIVTAALLITACERAPAQPSPPDTAATVPATTATVNAATVARSPAAREAATATVAATSRGRAVPGAAAPATQTELLVPELPRADRYDLARRFRGIQAATASTSGRKTEEVGDRRDFWVVQIEPPRAFQVTAELRRQSEHAAFWLQAGAVVSDNDLDRAVRDFEEKVYPGVTGMLGEPAPAPVDPEARIAILHLRLPGVGGYFTDLDQMPNVIAGISNERRMIYIDLRQGPPGSAGYPALVAHEFQHLVHQSLHPNAEAWINEGMSELAAEVVSGQGGSFLRSWRDAPGTALTDWSVDGNNSPHYGAAHSFLRYLLRRFGGVEQAGVLVGKGGWGVNAVQRYLVEGGYDATFESAFADWLVAGYLNLPSGPYSNAGADTKVRNLRRVSGPDSGGGAVRQFGADYLELTPNGQDMVFRFRGDGTIRRAPNRPFNGNGQWWSGRGDSIDTTLTREVDLTALSSATLRYQLWFDIERGYDYGYVALSDDGGASWTALRGRQTSDEDPLQQAYGPAYTGTSGGGNVPAWVEEAVDLSPWAGRKVLLRFEYVSDEAASAAGMAIDAIRIPELGYSDDAESDGGWQSSGFTRLSGPLPQRYLIQVIRQENGQAVVEPVAVAADGSADVRISGSVDRAAVIIAGATHGTNLAATYRWQFERAN